MERSITRPLPMGAVPPPIGVGVPPPPGGGGGGGGAEADAIMTGTIIKEMKITRVNIAFFIVRYFSL